MSSIIPMKNLFTANRICYRGLSGLSHVNNMTGSPVMVDVSNKQSTLRLAHARATVILPPVLCSFVRDQQHSSVSTFDIMGKKGPVLATAVIAGVMAAKKTSDLIPFCHPVALEDCKVDIHVKEGDGGSEMSLVIDCIVKTTHKTGVEMEAMVGATNAALCIYDMLKAMSHDIVIGDVKLISKSGGKSTFTR